MDMRLARLQNQSSSGLVVEYIVAIDVTRVRFPADAVFDVSCGSVCHLFSANTVAAAQRQDVCLAWQCVHVAVLRRRAIAVCRLHSNERSAVWNSCGGGHTLKWRIAGRAGNDDSDI